MIRQQGHLLWLMSLFKGQALCLGNSPVMGMGWEALN